MGRPSLQARTPGPCACRAVRPPPLSGQLSCPLWRTASLYHWPYRRDQPRYKASMHPRISCAAHTLRSSLPGTGSLRTGIREETSHAAGAVFLLLCIAYRFTVYTKMRRAGVEPAQPAWKAGVLPLNYRRMTGGRWNRTTDNSDLQSDALPTELSLRRVWIAGFEPATSASQMQRSTKLSYIQYMAGACYLLHHSAPPSARAAQGRPRTCHSP